MAENNSLWKIRGIRESELRFRTGRFCEEALGAPYQCIIIHMHTYMCQELHGLQTCIQLCLK